jgi:hypothetical protein
MAPHVRLTAPIDPEVVVCGCGAVWRLSAWGLLPYVGELLFDEAPFRLEIRQCGCKSSRSIWTDLQGALCDDDGVPLRVRTH